MSRTVQQLAAAAARFRRQRPYLPRIVGLIWRAAGAWSLAWLALLALQGLLPVAVVYLTRTLVDGLAARAGAGGGWNAVTPLLPAGAAMGLVLLGMEVCQGVSRWLRTVQAERVQDHIHECIQEQALRLDLSFYDSPAYYDQLHRARMDALGRPAALIENLGALLQSLITLVAMGGVLWSFGAWIPLLLVGSTLPALWVVLRHTLRFHRWRLANTTAMRRAAYLDMALSQRDMAAEMRLFGLGPHFQARFRALRRRLRDDQIRLARGEAAAQSAAAVIGLASLAGPLVWMVRRAVRGAATLGALALFVQAFFQGQRMLRALLSNAGEIYRNAMFLENLFEFLALEPRVVSPARPLAMPAGRGEVVFHDVTFRYPGMPRAVLEGFGLTLPAGRITALVGENGAGKTTLIRLLCRFYDPERGRLLLDGTDLRALSLPDLWRRITVLFQEPVRYHDTVFDNVAFGDLERGPTRERVQAAVRDAGADGPVGRLPDGYQTVLGKWFGGAELSAGEWQRLALARAFLRHSDLVILDEPTSSMDSWAESDWLNRFRGLVAGRTALIITHRFTTALQADGIHVMERGRIVESGTHADLLAAGGRYARSWRRQTEGPPG